VIKVSKKLCSMIIKVLLAQFGDTRSCPICGSAFIPRDTTSQMAHEAWKELMLVLECADIEPGRNEKADAARYRYLRESQHFGGSQRHRLEWYLPRVCVGDLRDQLDAAIDAEIKRLKL
jgi:hypothetical protein